MVMDKYCAYCSEPVGESSWRPHMRLHVCNSDKCKRQHEEAERAAAEAAEYRRRR
jgi:hypothetical protein